MYKKVNVRTPQGDIHDPCPVCEKKIIGGRASAKYKAEVTFVHTYKDKACTRWVQTEVFHSECYEESDAGKKVSVSA